MFVVVHMKMYTCCWATGIVYMMRYMCCCVHVVADIDCRYDVVHMLVHRCCCVHVVVLMLVYVLYVWCCVYCCIDGIVYMPR